MGDEPQRYPIKQGSQKVRDFLGRGRTPATPTSQASSLLQGRSDESKTVLDLLHSLGVEDDMIMFDNFGGICEQIRSIFSQRRRPNFGG